MKSISLSDEAKATIRKNVKFLLTMQIPLSEKLDKIVKPRLMMALRASTNIFQPLSGTQGEETSKPKQWVGRVKRLSKSRRAISKRDGFLAAPKLIANNAIVNKEGQTNLMHACIFGNVELIRELLVEGADVNHEDWTGKTALMYAVQFNRIESEASETVLVKAVKNKQVPIIGLLLSHAELINKRDIKGRTPLFHSVVLGQGLIVRLLMDAGASAEDLHDYEGANALEIAIENNEVDSIRALVFHPSFLLDKKLGAKIAIMATYLQDVEMLQELRNKGVKFEGLCPESHFPPLFIAYNLGFKPLVEFLLSVVTTHILTMISPSGDTLLTLATRKGDLEFIQKMLETTTVDVNQQDAMKRTALMIAAETGQVEILRKLLEFTADVDAQDAHYRTALMDCAMNGYEECVTALLEAKPKTCLTDARGRMALELAKTDWTFKAILDYMYSVPEKQTYEFNERVKRNLVTVVRNGKPVSSPRGIKRHLSGAFSEMSSPLLRPKTAKARLRTEDILGSFSSGKRVQDLVSEAFS